MTPQETWAHIGPLLLKRYKRTKTFLDHRNPWELLVAVILSAQMTDEGVNKITPELFKKYGTPAKMAKASVSDIVKLIKKINYHNSKARYLKQTAELLIKNFKGTVPNNLNNLLTLPGVGRKTAVAVLANAYKNYLGIPVDTHVIRFAKRFKLSSHIHPEKIERDLLALIPKKDWNRTGYAIKEYGRKEGRARGYNYNTDPLWKLLHEK